MIVGPYKHVSAGSVFIRGDNRLQPQLNRAIRYILYARSRTAGTQGESPVKGGRNREDGAKKASAVKLLWQSSGPRIAYRHNDTCVGYASQRRTPRPREWGEARKIPMERLCQPPSEPAFVLYREQENTAPPNGAKFVVNASHRGAVDKMEEKWLPT